MLPPSIGRAGMKQKDNPDPATEALRKAIYLGKKDFSAIRKLTEELEKKKN